MCRVSSVCTDQVNNVRFCRGRFHIRTFCFISEQKVHILPCGIMCDGSPQRKTYAIPHGCNFTKEPSQTPKLAVLPNCLWLKERHKRGTNCVEVHKAPRSDTDLHKAKLLSSLAYSLLLGASTQKQREKILLFPMPSPAGEVAAACRLTDEV